MIHLLVVQYSFIEVNGSSLSHTAECWLGPSFVLNCSTGNLRTVFLQRGKRLWLLSVQVCACLYVSLSRIIDSAWNFLGYVTFHELLRVTSVLSLCFNGHFPGEPGLPVVYWCKGWWRWWWQLDYWSYKSCKAPVKSSPPTNQHPVFLQAGCPFCHPTNSVKALKGKISHSMDLLTPSSPGVLPTLSLTTSSSWLPWRGLPCLTSALWCQYPRQYPWICKNVEIEEVVDGFG